MRVGSRRRFALVTFVGRAASQKRRQNRRTKSSRRSVTQVIARVAEHDFMLQLIRYQRLVCGGGGG
jgi:hypothetical protein